ncbi:MAG TPA: hypothetical protein VJS43_09120 [Candidatus Acidoferrales bacterium]|nr:hypothetical protein [Candidatus Acidoferrales bacterium]
MSERKKIQLLIALLAIAGGLYLYERTSNPSVTTGVLADRGFTPLNVQEPALQLDRLRRAQSDQYTGTQRNIFVAAPPSPLPGTVTHIEAPPPFVGPQLPPPPPPLQVPVEFYGIESSGGREVALLKNGDEPPIIVAEGDTFMNRFRLLRIGNQSAEVEEISSGRHATLPLVPPVDQAPGSIN